MNQEELLALLNQVDQKSIFFGPQGFEIFTTKSEIGKAQVGYGLDKHGQDLSGENEGDWHFSWLVIGRDTELGDVYFIDLNNNDCPVFTAFKGESAWEVDPVATSLVGFIACLRVLFKHGKQQGAVFVAEPNSIVDPILLKSLQSELIALSNNESFWTLFFNGYSGWLSEEY